MPHNPLSAEIRGEVPGAYCKLLFRMKNGTLSATARIGGIQHGNPVSQTYKVQVIHLSEKEGSCIQYGPGGPRIRFFLPGGMEAEIRIGDTDVQNIKDAQQQAVQAIMNP